MRHLFIAFCALITGAFIAGCTFGPSTTGVSIKGELNSSEFSDSAANIYLMWNLTIEKPVTQVKNGLMMVQVPLKNAARVDQSFQYQFRWFDDAGVAILSKQRPYEVVTVSGRDTAYAQAMAPTPEATKWECVVRRLNPEER